MAHEPSLARQSGQLRRSLTPTRGSECHPAARAAGSSLSTSPTAQAIRRWRRASEGDERSVVLLEYHGVNVRVWSFQVVSSRYQRSDSSASRRYAHVQFVTRKRPETAGCRLTRSIGRMQSVGSVTRSRNRAIGSASVTLACGHRKKSANADRFVLHASM